MTITWTLVSMGNGLFGVCLEPLALRALPFGQQELCRLVLYRLDVASTRSPPCPRRLTRRPLRCFGDAAGQPTGSPGSPGSPVRGGRRVGHPCHSSNTTSQAGRNMLPKTFMKWAQARKAPREEPGSDL
mmetsp:Transcript_72586/g.155463  ORF Transcript_72586/g.155463 Transcript_72586/m.155463 type:complete len:129 (+) Transcript_72586:432-818(+)